MRNPLKIEKKCSICGRDDSGERTHQDKRNGLTESDVQLKHCSDCGECVCGFCNALGVCCEG